MRTLQARNDFSAGELNPEALQRKDSRAAANGLALGRNIRLRNGGGYSRRPGSRQQQVLVNMPMRGEAYTYDDDYKYSLIFSAGRMDAFLIDGTPAGGLTGTAWDAQQALEMAYAPIDERIIVSHQVIGMFQITRTGPATWAIINFTWDIGPGTTSLQPYFRYAAKGISLEPSALTGTINVVFSDDVLTPQHVDIRFRYMGQELEIATVVDPQNGTANVVTGLPPTYTVTVGNTLGFVSGDRVEGDTSGTSGYVTTVINGTDMEVLIESGFAGFQGTEKIIGPNANSAHVSSAPATPAATVIWDEAMVSNTHGGPGEVAVHRKRLMLTDWRDAPDAWVASATYSIGDFDTGEALDNEAINEVLTASPRERIRHLVSSETLLMMTERNSYYIPEGRENVLTPTFASLFKAGRVGASFPEPVIVEQGVLFIEITGTRAVIMAPTGNITSPWAVTDVTRLVPHFMVDPIEVGTSDGNANAAERYAYVVNGDGTIAVLFYRDDDPIYGWTLWSTQGEWLSLWSIEGVVFTICRRTIDGVDQYLLERWDEELLVDCAVDFTDPDGDADLAGFETASLNVVEGTANYGVFEIGAAGAVTVNQGGLGLPTDGGHTFTAGFGFGTTAQMISPVLLQDVKASGPYLRIPRCWLTVQDSCVYKVNGMVRAAYDGGEDDSLPPPLRSETKQFRLTGRSPSPTVTISQDADTPSPLTVLSITMEVAGAAYQGAG